MYAGIWRKIAECEESYNRTDVLKSFKAIQKLRNIEQVVGWVRKCGPEATIEKGSLSSHSVSSGSCVTDYVLQRFLSEIHSLEQLKSILERLGMLDHPVIGIPCFTSNVRYWLDVYEGGLIIETDSYQFAAKFMRAVQIFLPRVFESGIAKDGDFRDLAQRILDSALEKADAVRTFARYGLDLYRLAGEPRPL